LHNTVYSPAPAKTNFIYSKSTPSKHIDNTNQINSHNVHSTRKATTATANNDQTTTPQDNKGDEVFVVLLLFLSMLLFDNIHSIPLAHPFGMWPRSILSDQCDFASEPCREARPLPDWRYPKSLPPCQQQR